MKKATGVIIALLALACVGSANATMFGFDAGAGFYQPRDSRWTGTGVDVAINAKISNDLTVGYRVEELNVKGSDSGIIAATGLAVGALNVTSQITFQGVQGWFTAARAMEDKLSADIGLWFGTATSNNFTTPAAAATFATASAGLSSPFIEPEVRLNYRSKGTAVDAQFSVNGGYRFVRNWAQNSPFFTAAGYFNTTTGAASGALTAPSRNLTDFDGLDIGCSFGLMF